MFPETKTAKQGTTLENEAGPSPRFRPFWLDLARVDVTAFSQKIYKMCFNTGDTLLFNTAERPSRV